MAYMDVVEKNDSELILKRSPSIRSWAVSAGVLFAGIALAYIRHDAYENPYWLLMYLFGCLFVAISCLGEWESCYFNKADGQIKLSRQSLFGKMFCRALEYFVVDLTSIAKVYVKNDIIKYTGVKMYTVCLLTKKGHTFQLTDHGTSGSQMEHLALCNTISTFLNKPNKKRD